jgi:hypothetical protein
MDLQVVIIITFNHRSNPLHYWEHYLPIQLKVSNFIATETEIRLYHSLLRHKGSFIQMIQQVDYSVKVYEVG